MRPTFIYVFFRSLPEIEYCRVTTGLVFEGSIEWFDVLYIAQRPIAIICLPPARYQVPPMCPPIPRPDR